MDEYLNREQAAEILDVSRETVRLWLKKGRLTPDLEIGGRQYFRRATIEQAAETLTPEEKGRRVERNAA